MIVNSYMNRFMNIYSSQLKATRHGLPGNQARASDACEGDRRPESLGALLRATELGMKPQTQHANPLERVSKLGKNPRET
jgi:hypothetical protein